ncbi:ent-kaur-16-ene synthase, chloroplastic-like isoform X3 [Prosopis cineraria]|uniref:ent-kaur-16-ene synthase, chloroplastic-like isoform X3 n=1 Tax=Prosopis cineraria TaxID=364024 RepID=UPI00240EB766|nr:ent-kaur-16-ene synthase, chloroplastic-like isoform X3 [Prosopis cineraria]
MFLGTTMSRSLPPSSPLDFPATSVGFPAKDKVGNGTNMMQMLEVNKERIKKLLENVELSVSSYDTAWVAMIPSPTSPQDPLFPQSLNWLLENQHIDGSWGLPGCNNELLSKDSLLSTLACVLTLKQWSVGEQQINRGLGYIESNIAAAHDDKQLSPIGFDIIFSHLIEQAQNMNLNLPFGGKCSGSFVQKRELELQSGWGSNSEGWKAYVAYISEGFGKSHNWEMIMKFQRNNGSLFNSPAATVAAYTHINNAHCLDYLVSLLDKFEHAVPTIHPFDVYARLHMVDSLVKLGINCHFKEEIINVLDDTWRMWQREEDDIVLEPTTCAMAFRLLRLHGYDVSSDALDRFSKDKFFNTLQGYLKDVEAVLELHKASHIVSNSNDSVLDELNTWTGHFLHEYLSSSSRNTHKIYNNIDHEVSFALCFPHHAYLDFVFNRRSIDHYRVDQKRILKSSYSSFNLANSEFLKLGVENFNHCRLLFHEELDLFNRWDIDVNKESCSETVKILFEALKRTICETATQVYKVQGRCVLNHLIQTWVDLLRSMLKEAEWSRGKCVPSIEEYERNGIITLALGPIIVPVVYLVGPKLPQAIIESDEYNRLFEVVSLHGRYLNDINGYQREKEQGKFINSISLRLNHGCGAGSEEQIIKEIKRKIDETRKELLRLVLQKKGSMISADVKDVYWKMCRTLHLAYKKDDVIHAKEMPNEVLNISNVVLNHPIILDS